MGFTAKKYLRLKITHGIVKCSTSKPGVELGLEISFIFEMQLSIVEEYYTTLEWLFFATQTNKNRISDRSER